MLTAQVYKLKPSQSQVAIMSHWLDMLRGAYNFCLHERIAAYEQVKAPILGNLCWLDTQGECCPLTCSVNKNALYGEPWTKDGKRRSALAQQDACLPELKKARPWYKLINAEVLQMNLRRLDAAYQNFFKEGKGYPKPKRRSKFTSFSYRPGQVKVSGNRVKLPGIGWMVFHNSRPLPIGFKIRTVTIRCKSNGWYMSVRLEDESVPAVLTIDKSQIQSAIGVDLGLKKLASVSDGRLIPNPRFGKRLERRKTRLNRAASRKKLGSMNRRKAYQRMGRLDQRIVNQRCDYHWKVAHQLVRSAACIVFEDLNIQGMTARCKPKKNPVTGKYLHNNQAAKSGLNKAILDTAWGDLKLKTKAVAEKSGVLVHAINPKHTSQECSVCGYISPVNRDCEKFLCENCCHYADADIDAAVVIRQRGLEELGIYLPPVPRVPRKLAKSTPKEPVERQGKPLGLPDGPRNPQQYIQLSLFEWREGG